MARASPGVIVIIVVILLLIYSPGSSPPSAYSVKPQDGATPHEAEALKALRTSTYEDFNLPAHENGQTLSLPGFRLDDGLNWQVLPLVFEKALTQSGHATMGEAITVNAGGNTSLLLYQNVTGWAKGTWMKLDTQEPLKNAVVEGVLNFSSIESRVKKTGRALTHNIIGSTGSLQLRLTEELSEQVSESDSQFNVMNARLEVQDDSSYADGWVWKLHGIHHRASGSIFLTTTSADFAGIFALPHMTLQEHSFNESRAFLDVYLDRIMSQPSSSREDSSMRPWESPAFEADGIPKAPACELVAWIQQFRQPIRLKSEDKYPDRASAAQANRQSFAAIEEELRFPVGLWTEPPPPLHFTATLFSPDCGYVLVSKGPPRYPPSEAQHLMGMKYEVRIGQGRAAMILVVLLLLGQLLLLIEQIHQSSTPSKKSRISFWTLVMLSLGDGFVAFGFLLLSSIAARLYTVSLAVAFLAFMSGLFFAMRFLLEVWNTQEPERLEQSRIRERRLAALRSNAPTVVPNAQAEPHSPSPGTERIDTGASPLALPSFQVTATEPTTAVTTGPSATFGAVYTRYCLFLLSMIFVSMWAASSWPISLQSLYANVLVFSYLSFWTPQIYRNVIRNCRLALSKKFVIGQSLLRLAPFAYFWGYQANVLFIEPDLRMMAIFTTWLWLQIVVLVGQEVLGPRFFISEKYSWIPPAWDYHPMLREDEEGSTLPIGADSASPTDERRSSLDSPSKADTRGKKIFDCAICMQKIEVLVVPAGDSPRSGASTADMLIGGFTARRYYSVTPCRHIFHSGCLENSMDYKLSCPVCRENLPPL